MQTDTVTGTETVTSFERYGVAGGIPLEDAAHPTTGTVPEGVLAEDLNRDGLADLVYFVGRWQYDADKKTYHWGGDWRYRLSTGTGFTAEVALVNIGDEVNVKADKSPSFYDYNQDGYPDFLWHDWALNRLKVKVWDPAQGGFESTDTTGTALRTGLDADEDYYFTLDVNGDGNADLAYYHEDTFETYLNEAAGRPNLITDISNGLGALTAIRVVTRVDGSAPVEGAAAATSAIQYAYEQAKLQAAGRGLLGFQALTTVDLQRGVRTTTSYRQDFPYIGYPVATEVVDAAGHVLRTATNTWQLQWGGGRHPAGGCRAPHHRDGAGGGAGRGPEPRRAGGPGVFCRALAVRCGREDLPLGRGLALPPEHGHGVWGGGGPGGHERVQCEGGQIAVVLRL